MRMMIVFYGCVLAGTAFVLTWLDYRFWMRDIGPEIYGLVLAVLFIGLGIWIGMQRKPTLLDMTEVPGHSAIQALGLTDRELQMLEHLSQGKGNKEIARDLELSPNTIKSHLANLYQKLDVNNRTQAVVKAAELSIK